MFEEFKKRYTDDEMIYRLWDKEVIMDQIGRFVLYWGNGERQRIMDELWVSETENRETASFATNIGFYVGKDEVKRHLVDEYEAQKRDKLKEFQDAGCAEAEPGMGLTATHSATTPAVFIANDGLTARALVYDLGMSGWGKADGTADCYFEVGVLLIELIRENGGWKLWHVVEQHDFTIESGKDYNDVPIVITDPNDPSMKDFGDPTIKKDVYDNQYGWEYLFYDMPKPYKSYDEDEGYGPEGKVGRKYYERLYN